MVGFVRILAALLSDCAPQLSDPEAVSDKIAEHGMIGAWLRSLKSLSDFLQTLPVSQFFYLDPHSRSKRRIYFFVGSWFCSKSGVFSHGG
jgi:hypothetical protein